MFKLSNLRTRAKLYWGFGLLMCLVFLAGLYTNYLTGLATRYAGLESDARFVESNFISARLNMRAYTTSRDEKSFQAADSNLDSVLHYTSSAHEKAIELNLPQLVTLLDPLLNDVTSYKARIQEFRKLTLELQQRNEEVAHGLEDFVDRVGRSGYYSELSHITVRSVKNFDRFFDLKQIKFIREAQKLAITELPAGLPDWIIEKVQRYRKLLANLMPIAESVDAQLQYFVKVSQEIMDENSKVSDLSYNLRVAQEAKGKLFMVIDLLLLLVVAGVLSYFIARNISINLRLAVQDIELTSHGDFRNRVPDAFLHYKDEVGDLARSISRMSTMINDTIREIRTGTDNISNASNSLSKISQQLSQGANSQAASAEEISSAMGEMSAGIDSNTQSAMETEKIAKTVEEKIGGVGKSAQQVAGAVRDIVNKINVINEIATQTNILALNAAVEAARAGEHGKGFSVVASEVRKLAERSKIAAEEIQKLSSVAVDVTDLAKNELEAVIPDVTRTVQLVQEISVASQEQRTGVEQINTAIQQLNDVVQQNASTSEEMATSAEELDTQAHTLQAVMEKFIV